MNELRDAPLVNCQHWNDHRCALGLHGGKPQLADCSKCPQRLSLPGTRKAPTPVRPILPAGFDPFTGRPIEKRHCPKCGE